MGKVFFGKYLGLVTSLTLAMFLGYGGAELIVYSTNPEFIASFLFALAYSLLLAGAAVNLVAKGADGSHATVPVAIASTGPVAEIPFENTARITGGTAATGSTLVVHGSGFTSAEYVSMRWAFTEAEYAAAKERGCKDAKSIARNTSAANSTNPYCYDSGIKGGGVKLDAATADTVSGAFTYTLKVGTCLLYTSDAADE